MFYKEKNGSIREEAAVLLSLESLETGGALKH